MPTCTDEDEIWRVLERCAPVCSKVASKCGCIEYVWRFWAMTKGSNQQSHRAAMEGGERGRKKCQQS